MTFPFSASLLRLGAFLCLLAGLSLTVRGAAVTGDFITVDPGLAEDGSQDDVFLVHSGVTALLSGGTVSGAGYADYNFLNNAVVSTSGVIYVLDSNPGTTSPSLTTIKSVNASTGVPTVVSGYTGTTTQVGSGTAFLDYENGNIGCEGMAWDRSTSTLLVCDPGNGSTTSQLVRVNPSTGARSLVSGDGTGTGTAFVNLAAIAVTPAGIIYVADCRGYTGSYANSTIFEVNPANGNRTIVGGYDASGTNSGTGSQFTLGTNSTNQVHGMAWDPSTSTLLITDSGNFSGNAGTHTQVLRLNPATHGQTVLTGTSTTGTVVGTGTALTWAYSLSVSGSNKIYLTDSANANSKIWLVDPATGNRTAVNTSGVTASENFQGVSIVGTQVAVTAVSSTQANGAFKAGSVVPITVTFSGAVTVTGTPEIALNSGGTANYSSGSGTTVLTFNYTVGSSDTTQDLDCASTAALTLNSGTISGPGDAFSATLTLPIGGTSGSLESNKSFVIDTTVPSIAIGAPSASSIVTASGGTVTYTVTYADTNFSASTLAAGNITLNATGSASATVAVTGTGTTRTVTLSSFTGNGSLGITIGAGTATDTAGNLAPAATSTTFLVTKATATVTLGGLNATYTGSSIAASATTSPGGLSVTFTYNGSSTAPLAAGTYTVVGSISSNSYQGSSTPGTLTISPASLTVSGVTASNKVYNAQSSATISAGGATLVGVLNSDNVTLVASSATGTFPSKIVGTNLTVTVSGLTLGGTAAGDYTLSQPTTTASITAAPLAVTGVSASNRIYDSTTTASLVTGTAALSGVYSGDTVSLSAAGAAGMFATKTVGSAKPVSTSGFSISGADSANYTLTQPSTSATITAASLTVNGLTANSKVYDSTTSATLNTGSATLVGVFSGDSVSLITSGAVGSFASKVVAVGQTVSVSGLTISGGDSGNYVVVQPTTTATITPATLTVSGITANNKTYDATTSATLVTGSASLLGVFAGDAVVLNTGASSGIFNSKVVATGKTVTISGLSVSGADSGNYALVQPTTTASITSKAITVTGITANNKVYDSTTVASLTTSGAALVGVISGDVVTLVTSGDSASFATKTVGSAKTVTISGLTLGGADSGNYSLTQPSSTATISTASLTVSGIVASNKAYDTTTLATLSTSGAALVGVLGSDLVTLNSSGASGAFASQNVGTGLVVTISGLTITNTDSGNYVLVQPTTTASITAQTLTVTADNQTRPYGTANPTLTASIAGYAGSENSSVISGSPLVSTTASLLSVAGPYPITPSLGSLVAANGNYVFSFVGGTLSVTANPRASWRYANFGTVDDTGSAGDYADPDGDGLVNLLEYALGSDPNTPSVTALPVLSESGPSGNRYLTLTVTRNASATDITFTVESSTDLVNWTSSGLTTLVNTSTTLAVQDSAPLGSSPRYLHLRVDPVTTTPPVGGVELSQPAGAGSSAPAYAYYSAPFVGSQLWCGPATAVTAQTLTYANANWSTNQFTSSPCYVELLDGSLAGMTIDITSQTSNTLTLASAALGSYSAGMRFSIRSHATLSSTFGATSPTSLNPSTNAALADNVETLNTLSQTWPIYYYKSGGLGGTGWRSSASASADTSGTVIDREQGMYFVLKSTARTLPLIGDAEFVGQIIPLQIGYNLLSVTEPIPVTLASLNLNTGDPTTGLVGDTDVTTADEVQCWSGSAWVRYYYQTSGAGGTGWRSSTDSVTDQSALTFNPASVLMIVKKHGGEALYSRPAAP